MKITYIFFILLLVYGCSNKLPEAWVEWSHEERILYLAKTEMDTKKPILFFWSVVCPNEKVDLISNELISAGYGVARVYDGFNLGTSVVDTVNIEIPHDLKVIREYGAKLGSIASKYECDKPILGISGYEK